MSYLRGGMPRNTSNGDYGRFHALQQLEKSGQNGSWTSNGNRMVQQVHYPNCQNGNLPAPQTFSDGKKEYTIEYGEDAVRAALGGQYPDFQAQFEKQYGGGGGDAGATALNPQVMQAMGDGKSKVAMIPVVMTSEDDHEQGGSPGQLDGQSKPDSDQTGVTASVTPSREQQALPTGEETDTPAKEESAQQETASVAQSFTTNRETITNAYDQARKARASGPIKYGRHVRPSYSKVEGGNPCRRKTLANDAQNPNPAADSVQDGFNGQQQYGYEGMGQVPYNEMSSLNINGYEGYPSQPPMPQGQQYYQAQQQQQNPQFQQQPQMGGRLERGRSLPPKKIGRPTYALCGKCKKCKNLRSGSTDPSVLTFPMYSSNGPRRDLSQVMTSSNLGQSAKNFRAIRFSSYNNN